LADIKEKYKLGDENEHENGIFSEKVLVELGIEN